MKMAVSSEDLARHLVDAVEDVRAEQAEGLAADAAPAAPPRTPEQQASRRGEIADAVANPPMSMLEKLGDAIRRIDAGLLAFGEEVKKEAERIGVSAGHLLSRTQKRLLRALIDSILLPPIAVPGGSSQPGGVGSNAPTALPASKVVVTSKLTVSPTLKAADPEAILEVLVSLLDFDVNVEVDYGTPSGPASSSSAAGGGGVS